MIDEASDQAEIKRKDAVASVAGHLSVLSNGNHALLRRMFLTEKLAADGVVVKLFIHAGLKPHEYENDFPAWRTLVHIAALLSGTGRMNPHNPRRGFGTALREADFSENRFLRLTAARDEALRDQVVLAARMLAAAANRGFNLRTLLHLIGSDPNEAEAARLRMAQDYYATGTRSGEDDA